MRVLLVSYRFPPDTVGGLERYTQSLAAELVKAGHRVTIVARRTEPGRPNIRQVRERLPDGTELYRIIGPDARFDRFLSHHERFDEMFTMALLRSKPDIVHINHVLGFSPRIVQIANRFGAAVVLSLHDFYFACPRIHLRKTSGDLCEGSRWGRECAATCFNQSFPDSISVWRLRAMYFERTMAAAQALIAYSEYVASYFKYFTAATKAVHVIPNAVPPELVSSQDVAANADDAETLSIAYCGTVAAHKGPHLILEALRVAGLNRTEVLLIGHAPEPPYVKQLRELARGVPGLKLRLYGRYERADLRVLLSGVDCVVVPSIVPEAGPIVPREALACGVPVIAAQRGALPEVIVEGANGFTFDPTKPAELASILRRLKSDSTILPRLREGARKFPVCTSPEHAVRVCEVYGHALRDFEGHRDEPRQMAELKFLHESLIRLGCDSSRIASSR